MEATSHINSHSGANGQEPLLPAKRPREPDEWRICQMSAPRLMPFMLGTSETTAVRELTQVLQTCAMDNAVAVVGVYGSGGVGKTTACTVAVHGLQVADKFRDGVLWMKLGLDATHSTVVEKLTEVVESAGGFENAAHMRGLGARGIGQAIRLASEWFDQRRILLVVDDVYPMPGRAHGNWIKMLRNVLANGSCVLFTTRSVRIACCTALHVNVLPLDDRQYPLQHDIFMAHLGIDDEHPDFARDICEDIIGACHGVPLALSSAAAHVATHRYSWLRACNRLGEVFFDDDGASEDLDPGGHEGVASVFTNGLRGLGAAYPNLCAHLCWEDLYYSLAVLDESSCSMNVGVLSVLWDVGIQTAERICEAFSDFGLAQLSDGAQPMDRTMRLHGFQLAFCKRRASEMQVENTWHERMVNHFVDLVVGGDDDSSSQDAGELTASRIVDALCVDGPHFLEQYFLENLVRHVYMMRDGLQHARLVLADHRWWGRVCPDVLAWLRGLPSIL